MNDTKLSACISLFRTQIRDMVVRGAPAIGVSAALSIAVELVNHAPFQSARDVEAYTIDALDYLVTRCAQAGVASLR